MKKKTKKIQHARSDGRGIVIYSNIVPEIGVRTYYNIDEQIVARIQFFKDEKYLYDINDVTKGKDLIKIGEKLFEKSFIVQVYIMTVIKFVLLLVFLGLMLSGGNLTIILLIGYLVISQMFERLIIFFHLACLYKVKGKLKYKTSKFHSAEHKATNAYEKYQRIPTYREVEQASPYTKYCGSRYLYMPTIYDIINILLIPVFSFITQKLWNYINLSNPNMNELLLEWSFFIILISLAACIYCLQTIVRILENIYKFGIFNFMQFFFTNKPTQREIVLSIIAIENYEILENYIASLYSELKNNPDRNEVMSEFTRNLFQITAQYQDVQRSKRLTAEILKNK